MVFLETLNFQDFSYGNFLATAYSALTLGHVRFLPPRKSFRSISDAGYEGVTGLGMNLFEKIPRFIGIGVLLGAVVSSIEVTCNFHHVYLQTFETCARKYGDYFSYLRVWNVSAFQKMRRGRTISSLLTFSKICDRVVEIPEKLQELPFSTFFGYMVFAKRLPCVEKLLERIQAAWKLINTFFKLPMQDRCEQIRQTQQTIALWNFFTYSFESAHSSPLCVVPRKNKSR